ncbi:hypothetical protein L3Q82_015226 [Scortum barcoo]|uniref:Uncharacterized protein n=1 Tax=Scortum barcoo TaxID=214431 RepID=A0ACB8VTR2_9TELE|nr:hypothetical protein L3Q82_015226 [Scortum barcoo]
MCHISDLKLSLILTAFLKKQDGVKSSNTVQQTVLRSSKRKKNLCCDLFKDELCPKCDINWEQHGGKYYYFSNNKLTWNESRGECKDQGGDLVKIDSTEEQKFLAGKLREKMNKGEDKFWIGLTNSQKEGTWLWVDGSPLNTSLTFWHKDEPDNWTKEDPDGEDCAMMGEKSRAADLKCWFESTCKRRHRRICEKSAKCNV